MAATPEDVDFQDEHQKVVSLIPWPHGKVVSVIKNPLKKDVWFVKTHGLPGCYALYKIEGNSCTRINESLFGFSSAEADSMMNKLIASNSNTTKSAESVTPSDPPVVTTEEIPSEYTCPISCAIMESPVVAQDGFIYEEKEIKKWLETHNTSPMTGKEMAKEPLTLCFSLRSAIIAWKEKNQKKN